MRVVLLFVSILFVTGFTIPDNTGSKFTSKEAQQILRSHNEIRYNSSTEDKYLPRLEWDSTVAATAQEWATYLKNIGGKLQYRPKKGKYSTKYGENIALVPTSAKGFIYESMELWLNEAPYEVITAGTLNNPVTKDVSKKYGHCLQIIWGATQRIGAGYADLGNGHMIVVCNYDPPGNIIGQKFTDGSVKLDLKK